jgi:hypothetical protein
VLFAALLSLLLLCSVLDNMNLFQAITVMALFMLLLLPPLLPTCCALCCFFGSAAVQGALDNMNLFQVITIMAFFMLLPVSILIEGLPILPQNLAAAVRLSCIVAT